MSELVLPAPSPQIIQRTPTVAAGRAARDLQRRQRILQFQYPAKERLAQELLNLLDAQVVASWYGPDAGAASREAVLVALGFLSLLSPACLVDLDISPDEDGDVSFDWYAGPQKQLSIRFGASAELHYAAILGPIERVSGRLSFNDSIPEEIARVLGRIV